MNMQGYIFCKILWQGGGGGMAGWGEKMKMESQGKKFKKWREKGGKLHEKKGNGP